MNLLLLFHDVHATEGGAQRYNQRVVRCIAETLPMDQGLSADVLVLNDRKDSGPTGAADSALRLKGFGGNRRRFAAAMVRQCLTRRPQTVFIGHIALTSWVTLLRVIRPGARYLLLVYGREVWASRNPLRRLIVRYLIDEVVAISQYTAERMASPYGLDLSRFKILPAAIDLQPQKGGSRSQDHNQVLTVSRLESSTATKHIDKAIEAFRVVCDALPDARYVIVGDGDLRVKLESLTNALGLTNKVIFTGRIPDDERNRLYGLSAVFLLPSTTEGFGIVYLEAWQWSLPVIAGNNGAALEIVHHGEDGLRVSPEAGAIADAVISLLSDRDQASKMGASGYRRLLQSYTHDHFLKNLKAILTIGVGNSG